MEKSLLPEEGEETAAAEADREDALLVVSGEN